MGASALPVSIIPRFARRLAPGTAAMKPPRVSILKMIYVVLVLAVNCAWLPNIWKMISVFGFSWHCLDLPILGAGNALAAVDYPLLSRGRGRRPFRIGFAIAGLLSIACYMLYCGTSEDRRNGRVTNFLLFFQYQYHYCPVEIPLNSRVFPKYPFSICSFWSELP